MLKGIEQKTIDALSVSSVSGIVRIKGIGAHVIALWGVGGISLLAIVLNFITNMIHEFHAPATVVEQKTTVAPATTDITSPKAPVQVIVTPAATVKAVPAPTAIPPLGLIERSSKRREVDMSNEADGAVERYSDH